MKAASGLEVSLVVAGVDLYEYEAKSEDDGLTLSSYVEATLGSTFALRFTAPPGLAPTPNHSVNCRIYLDGKFSYSLLFKGEWFARVPYTYTIEGVERMTVCGRELKRFEFAQRKTNEDPIPDQMKPDLIKALGSVSVQCTWCREEPIARTIVRAPSEPIIETSISVKCLKGRAISNKASVAKAEYLAGTCPTVDISHPYGSKPFASFEFKYRSRKDLQIEGIIKKSPEPVALQDRDPGTLTREEVAELQRQLQVKTAETMKIEREKRAWRLDDGLDDDDVVELTAGPSQKIRKSLDSRIVVDLTDD